MNTRGAAAHGARGHRAPWGGQVFDCLPDVYHRRSSPPPGGRRSKCNTRVEDVSNAAGQALELGVTLGPV